MPPKKNLWVRGRFSARGNLSEFKPSILSSTMFNVVKWGKIKKEAYHIGITLTRRAFSAIFHLSYVSCYIGLCKFARCAVAPWVIQSKQLNSFVSSSIAFIHLLSWCHCAVTSSGKNAANVTETESRERERQKDLNHSIHKFFMNINFS